MARGLSGKPEGISNTEFIGPRCNNKIITCLIRCLCQEGGSRIRGALFMFLSLTPIQTMKSHQVRNYGADGLEDCNCSRRAFISRTRTETSPTIGCTDLCADLQQYPLSVIILCGVPSVYCRDDLLSRFERKRGRERECTFGSGVA